MTEQNLGILVSGLIELIDIRPLPCNSDSAGRLVSCPTFKGPWSCLLQFVVLPYELCRNDEFFSSPV